MNNSENISEETKDLVNQIILVKADIGILLSKKRLLLEEIHRQFLEGELDPKKRTKFLCDKIKKN